MTGPGDWFYHVAYQYPIRGGWMYGDITITLRWRMDSDAKVREVRSALGADTPERIGEVVITSITLLAPGAVPDDTGRLPGCPCGLTGAVAPKVAVLDPDCPHHGA